MRGFAYFIGAALTVCAGIAAANPVVIPADMDALRACLRANLPEQSMVQDIRLQSTDAGGDRTLTGRVYGMRLHKEVAVMIRVDGPADMSGTRYLVISGETDDAMWVYLPALDRVRRIAGSLAGQTLWGSDFSYDDVKLLRGLLMKGDTEYGGQTTWSERPAVNVTVRPQPAMEEPDVIQPYTRAELVVDAQTCMIAQGQFFDSAGLVKELTIEKDDLMQVGDRWMPRKVVLRNVREDTQSELVVEKISYDEDLRARLFDPRTFAR